MLLDKIFSECEVKKSATIYEYECNTDYMLKYLSKAGYDNLYWFDKAASFGNYVKEIASYAMLDWEAKYDVILLAKVLCMMGRPQREDIIRKLYAKLNPRGILIIEEYNTLEAIEHGVRKSFLTKLIRKNRLIGPENFDKFYRNTSLLNNIYGSRFYRLKQALYQNTDVGIIYASK